MCWVRKDSRKSINILGKIPETIGNIQVLLVRYIKIEQFLYENQKKNQMDSKLITNIINSQEPIAIMKYFEWPIFSNDYANARFTILRIDKKHNDIREFDIPINLVSFIRSKTDCFEKVLKLKEGIIWERMRFRELVKSSIPKARVHQLINQW